MWRGVFGINFYFIAIRQTSVYSYNLCSRYTWTFFFQIEIASMLSFNKKTYIRAYVEYYRHKVDILELKNDFTALLTAGSGRELYLKNRSIGTMEVVLVEMKFHNKKKAGLLKKSRYQSLSMRDWFSHAKAVGGEPANTKVCCLFYLVLFYVPSRMFHSIDDVIFEILKSSIIPVLKRPT